MTTNLEAKEQPVQLVVYSDYLCPWCLVASLRLQDVQNELGRNRVELQWKSFLLRPQASHNRSLQKFKQYTQSWQRPAMEEPRGGYQEWASEEGPPSSSVPPHLVMKAARRIDTNAAEKLHWLLFEAYFQQSRDITAHPVLQDLWLQAGLAGERFAEPFEDELNEELRKEIVADHNEALEYDANGVPAVRLAHAEVSLAGALPKEMYQRLIERALESG